MERQIVTKIDNLNDPLNVGRQVSKLIEGYNSGHSFEMLPKSPEVVVEHLEKGLSVVIVDKENSQERVLFHATLEANFNDKEEKLLGMQVAELGGWVVPEFARGQGNGTEGVNALIKLANSIWDNPLLISTHKRMAALRVSQHNGLDYVDYRELPYTTYLTCTCSNCSERAGHEICKFRRITPNIEIINGEGKIACTLVVSSFEQALEFESRCRELNSITGEQLYPGEISIERMQIAGRFFDWIKQQT